MGGIKKYKKNNRKKVSLFPVEIEQVLSLQEAKQKAGWNITAFNLPENWKISKGENVKVAVLDTGVDLYHKDLIDNLLPGKNFIEKRNPPQDGNGHGTHVAGIIAATNNDIGMVGVAPEAKIIPVKVLNDQGDGFPKATAEGIMWAVDVAQADMICMSLGAPFLLSEVYKAIKHAWRKNVPCFVAAGNAGKTKEVFYPANYKETIAIGSISENFDRSSFSNTGTNLDFMAPGNKIFSTVPTNWYAIMSGTSQATPFVVGVAALLLSYNKKNRNSIKLNSVEDYRRAFRRNAKPVKNMKWKDKKFYQGFGIIDPVALMTDVSKLG